MKRLIGTQWSGYSDDCANREGGRCESCGVPWQDYEVGPGFKCPHFRAHPDDPLQSTTLERIP